MSTKRVLEVVEAWITEPLLVNVQPEVSVVVMVEEVQKAVRDIDATDARQRAEIESLRAEVAALNAKLVAAGLA